MLEMLQLLMAKPAELKQACLEIKLALPSITARNDLSVLGLNATIDKISVEMPMIDVPGLFKLPILVEADGNCMPRCGSLIAYGTENHHLEIRLRIFIEMVWNEAFYTNECTLSRAAPLASLFSVASTSDYYDASVHMCPTEAIRVYRAEVRDTLIPGKSCCLWHLMAMASILKVPVMSLYPQLGMKQRQEQMQRLIYPREPAHDINVPYYIMWTSTRTDMNVEYWVSNHVTLFLVMSDMSVDSPVDMNG